MKIEYPEGIDPSRAYTAAEFARLPRPKCPVCGEPMGWGRVDVSDASSLVDKYMLSAPTACANHCICE